MCPILTVFCLKSHICLIWVLFQDCTRTAKILGGNPGNKGVFPCFWRLDYHLTEEPSQKHQTINDGRPHETDTHTHENNIEYSKTHTNKSKKTKQNAAMRQIEATTHTSAADT